MEQSELYGEVIVKEVLKRKEVLLEMNGMRNPEANKKKTAAWKEIQEIVLTSCKKIMTVDQIKRAWRNKKAHVKDVLMTEKRYRSSTGGGVDMALESAIKKNLEHLSEAELGIAKSLGREAAFVGLRKAETFVDEDSPSRLLSESGTSGNGEGGRTPEYQRGVGSPPFVDKDAVLTAKMKKLEEQLNTFRSESSSDEELPKKRKRSSPTDKEINRLQLEILKEEKALIAKKSILLDKQIAFYDTALKTLTGKPIGVDSGNCPMWAPHEGDPHLAMSTFSK
ncbi:hypothetical protein Y032_0013g2107 [Ancylostoma ceylanicum]|uniref:Regulatory protein zeste n=1 Tax=Ancylostoma ceylanicum TaxID=53326 RepID=A0A016VBG0_9BILA|nr:hypothetical protein Y032_0013g2107 [Ancylostoma ceylanicum]